MKLYQCYRQPDCEIEFLQEFPSSIEEEEVQKFIREQVSFSTSIEIDFYKNFTEETDFSDEEFLLVATSYDGCIYVDYYIGRAV
jgi:hypothetical protein